MAYKIFLSYTNKDHLMADVVRRVLQNAFEGLIQIYMAKYDLYPGREWKEELKVSLRECDAIISLYTKKSVNKPWLLIEWSVFWVYEKPFYTLVTDDVKLSDLVNPMQDRQMIKIYDADFIRNFLKTITEDAKGEVVPYHHIETFITDIRSAEKEQDKDEYEWFASNLEALPESDAEIREIAFYFFDQGKYHLFSTIVSKTLTDTSKVKAALRLLELDAIEHLPLVTQHIRANVNLEKVAKGIIEQDLLDSSESYELFRIIAHRSQMALYRLCVDLIDLQQESTPFFSYILDLFTNMEQFKLVAIHLIRNNKLRTVTYQRIILVMSKDNLIALRKVGFELVAQGFYNTNEFTNLFETLLNKRPEEAAKLMYHVEAYDTDIFDKYGNDLRVIPFLDAK